MKFKNIITIFAFIVGLSGSYAFADNAIYVLAARKGNLDKTLNRISDVVANATTTGYKTEYDIYNELQKKTGDNTNISFSTIGQTKRDYAQGGLNATGRPLDLAINGSGFFMVETPRGPRYTRAGNFQINSNGTLTTSDNYAVTGPGGGTVEFTETDTTVTVREDGLVQAGIEDRGQIGVFIFNDEKGLIKEDHGLYRSAEIPQVAVDSKIVQGALESSNVNSVKAMASLIETSRNIEMVQKIQSEVNDLKLHSIRTLTGK